MLISKLFLFISKSFIIYPVYMMYVMTQCDIALITQCCLEFSKECCHFQLAKKLFTRHSLLQATVLTNTINIQQVCS